MLLPEDDGLSNPCNKCFDTSTLEQEYLINSSFTIIACILSIFGSSLIILSYVLWKDVRKSTARAIVFCLAICDLMSASGYLSAPIIFYANYNASQTAEQTRMPIPLTACKFQSFWTTFFVLVSFFWTSYLAVYFVITLVLQKTQWTKKLMIFFILTSWTIPLVICVVAISLNWLGPARYSTVGSWCWVSDKNLVNNITDGEYEYLTNVYFAMEAITGKFWEILTYAIVVVSTLIVIINNRCIWQKEMANAVKPGSYTKELITGAYSMRNIELRLVALPLVLILFRIFGTARYIMSTLPCCHTASYSDNSDDIGSGVRLGICITDKCGQFIYHPLLMALQAIGDPLQGFGNAVLFVFLSKVILLRYQMLCKKVFRWLCSCFRRDSPVVDEDNAKVQFNNHDVEENQPLFITYTSRKSVKQEQTFL